MAEFEQQQMQIRNALYAAHNSAEAAARAEGEAAASMSACGATAESHIGALDEVIGLLLGGLAETIRTAREKNRAVIGGLGTAMDELAGVMKSRVGNEIYDSLTEVQGKGQAHQQALEGDIGNFGDIEAAAASLKMALAAKKAQADALAAKSSAYQTTLSNTAQLAGEAADNFH